VQIVNPVGPATCADVPSFQSQTGALCPYTTPEASTILAGPALDADREVTGTPIAHLVVSSTQPSDVRLFLTLSDVDASGKGTPILKQTVPVRLASGASTDVEVTLQSITANIAKGHSVGLQVATTDAGFFSSREGGAVTISSSAEKPTWLAVPFVPKDKWGDHAAPKVSVEATPALAECAPEAVLCPRSMSYLLNVTVVDAVGLPEAFLAAHSHHGSVGPLTFGARAAGHASVLLSAPMPRDAASEPVPIQLTAFDLLGNNVTVTWQAPSTWAADGCAQGVGSLCPAATATTKKKTPGFEVVFLLAAFAVVLALRRRV
jgi:hypothetical protein